MLGANLFKMMLRVEESEERFKEMTHWMLSLFLPVYHTFRERHGLCPCISSPSFQPSSSSSSSSSSLSLTARLALTGGTPLLYGVSEFFFPKPGYWPKAAVFCGAWRWEEEDVREGKEEWKEKWMPSEALQRFVEGEEGKEDTEATTCALARKGGEGEGKEGAMALPVLPASLPRPPLICLDMGSCVEVGLRTRSEWEGLIEGVVEALRRAFPGGGGGGGREGGRGGGSPDNPEKGEKRTGYGSGGFRLLLLHFPPSSSLGAEVALEKDEEWGVDEQQQQQQQQQQQKLTCDDILRLPVEEYVPHSWLFPRCHLVLHHGGLGSTMACIGARGGGGGGGGGKEEGGEGGGGGGGEGGGEGGEGGGRGVPQLVLQCTEEQRVWGERVAYLGIGAVMGREGEQDGGIEEAVYQALKGLERGREICLKTIRRYAGWLREEDGVGRAVEVLMEEMSRRRKKRRKEEEEEEEEEEEGEEE
ncbi:glycosyl transferase [Nannochloropsis oceanica]